MSDNKTNTMQSKFESEKKEILECQKNKNLNSCFGCKNLLECKTREKYIKAVYGSMSQGNGGGFEF